MKSMLKYSYLLHWVCNVKDLGYIKINNVNPLYLIFNQINGCVEKSTWNKYLTLVATNESKSTIKKYEEQWTKMRYPITLKTNTRWL